MARAALGWTVRDLAERSGVHRNTVVRLEAGAEAERRTIATVRKTLEDAGVIFVDETTAEGAGVRMRKGAVSA